VIGELFVKLEKPKEPKNSKPIQTLFQPTILSLPSNKSQSIESVQKNEDDISSTKKLKNISNINNRPSTYIYDGYQPKNTNGQVPHLNGILSQSQLHHYETLNSNIQNNSNIKTQSPKSENHKEKQGGIHSLLHSQLVIEESQKQERAKLSNLLLNSQLMMEELQDYENVKLLNNKPSNTINFEKTNQNLQFKKQEDNSREQQTTLDFLQPPSNKVLELEANDTLEPMQLRKNEKLDASKYKPMKQTQDQNMELPIKPQILESNLDGKTNDFQYDMKRSMQDEFLQMHASQLYENSTKNELQSSKHTYKRNIGLENDKEKNMLLTTEDNPLNDKFKYENNNFEPKQLIIDKEPTVHWNPLKQHYADECIGIENKLQSNKIESINEVYAFGRHFFQKIAHNTQLEIQANLKAKVHHLTPKRSMSVDGFLGSSGRLSWHQKHERSAEILKEGGPM
jgi:hypothetical protein